MWNLSQLTVIFKVMRHNCRSVLLLLPAVKMPKTLKDKVWFAINAQNAKRKSVIRDSGSLKVTSHHEAKVSWPKNRISGLGIVRNKNFILIYFDRENHLWTILKIKTFFDNSLFILENKQDRFVGVVLPRRLYSDYSRALLLFLLRRSSLRWW